MSDKRRKAIDEIVSSLEDIQAQLASIKGDEESAHDNMPESRQDSDLYYEQEEAIEAMENADGSLQEAIDYLTEII